MRGNVGDLILHQISPKGCGAEVEGDTPFLQNMALFENRAPKKNQRFIMIFLIRLVLTGGSITLLSMSEDV